MKPGRLFWKLFLGFWLATALSFTVVFAIFEYNERVGPDSGTWMRSALFANIAGVVGDQGGDAARPLVDYAVHKNLPFSLRRLADDETINPDRTELYQVVTGPDGSRYLLESRAPILRKPSHRLPFAVGTLVSIIFSGIIAWHLSRPLRQLGDAARALAKGKLSTRVLPLMQWRKDEIMDVAREFDRMAAQLEQLLAAQRRLLHDISHELRSPLTRLRAAIGLVHQSPEQQAGMLARIERECERLDELIEELLTLARLESGQHNLPYERVDLIELLSAIAEDASFEAAAKDCRVNLTADPAFVTWVSGEMLYRAFENIVRNAVKFTEPGTEVRITARVGGPTLVLTVSDQGPGVPADMLDSIFEPFKRLEGSEAIPGLGLGLSIAQRAVQMHGGTITAIPGPTGGLTIRVTLPQCEGQEKS